jgi:RluA family pseudouridine synthase
MAADEEVLSLEIGDAQAGLTVLQVLGDRFHDVPTSQLRELVRLEGVLRNERPPGPNQRLEVGDRLEVWPAGLVPLTPTPLRGFAVLHEDEHLLVCDKPAGVSVEADRGDEARPLKAALLHHLRGGPPVRPRVAHRLDKDTSGVIVIAKSRQALAHLTRQFEEHSVQKEYLAIVSGRTREAGGEIDRPLAPRAKRGRGRTEDAKPARSTWEVVEQFRRHTLMRVRPLTGRQHQVRQHLAALGVPIVCDHLYGSGKPLLLSNLKPGDYNTRRGREEKPLLGRLGLHAHRLAFQDLSGQRVEVEAEPPKDFQTALARLRKYDPD